MSNYNELHMHFRIIFFVLCPIALFAQELPDDLEANAHYHNGQIVNDTLVVFSEAEAIKYPLNDNKNPVSFPIDNYLVRDETRMTESSALSYFYSVVVENEVYFIEEKGGKIYKYIDNSLKRIDRSYSHRMQIGSTVFSRDKTIYRFGGYGFWSMRNFFTYFSSDIMEWEAESPINTTKTPPGLANYYLSHTEDQAIIFGGNSQDPNNLNNPRNLNDEVWLYDFIKAKWNLLGPLELNLSKIRAIRMLADEILVYLNDNTILRIQPFKNKVVKHMATTLQQNLYNKKGQLAVYKKDKNYYSFVLYDNLYDNLDKVELEKRAEDEFFGTVIGETKLYQDYSNWRYLFLLLIIPIAYYSRKIIISFKVKQSKIAINDKGLIYKRVFYDYEEKEMEVIKLLMEFDVVHSSDILDLVENPNHNYSHNMRTKNQLIDKINYKLKTMLKIDFDLITSEKSREDRRIIDYKMNKTYFN